MVFFTVDTPTALVSSIIPWKIFVEYLLLKENAEFFLAY
jgi:hypothetical protein